MKLFQNKGYSQTHSTKATAHVLPTALSTPHLPQRFIQQSPSTPLSIPQSAQVGLLSIKEQSQASSPTGEISPARIQQPSKAAQPPSIQSLAPTKKHQSPAAKKQPKSSQGKNMLATNSLSHDVQAKNSSPQKPSRPPSNNSQSKQGPLGSQHLPTSSTPPQKQNESPRKQLPRVNALSLQSVYTESTKQLPPDTAGSYKNTPEYSEPCMSSALSSDGPRTAMNIKAPHFQNSRKGIYTCRVHTVIPIMGNCL